ncbi:MAG: energy transducer TonB [Steroidobacteraceae bacterium]
MSAATVHSFPALNALSSPRGVVLAVIVLLHAGFFWSLNNGLSRSVLVFVPTRIQASFIEEPARPEPAPPPKPVYQPQFTPSLTPEPPPVLGEFAEGTNAILVDPAPVHPQPVPVTPARAVVVPPQVDAKRGLTEPTYPAQDVRLGNEGTVMLSVYVLADGAVGEVRLLKTSGFPRLDASALSEAHRWKFQPGTEDGKPAAMWKQLPITFRLVR